MGRTALTDPDLAAIDDDLGLVDRLEPGRHRPDPRLDVATGRQDRVAHQHRRPAGRCLLVVRDDGGVAHDDRDPVERRTRAPAAAIWAKIVRAPWPMSDVPAWTIDAPVGQQPDGRIRQAGGRPRLEPDGQAATATGRRRTPPPDQLGRPFDGPRPVPVGRRVARDERVAAVGRGSAGEARAGRCRGRVRPRPCSTRPPRSAADCRSRGTRSRAWCATGCSGRRCGPPGSGTARSRCSCPWRPCGRRCPRRLRSGSSPRCRGRRCCRRCGTRSGRGSPRRLGERPGRSPRGSGPGGTDGRSASAMNATSGSYLACCLPPNPPPGSGAKTRTLERGRWRRPAMTRCSQFGCWIELQIAIPSPSGAAMNPCGSMANCVTIGKV